MDAWRGSAVGFAAEGPPRAARAGARGAAAKRPCSDSCSRLSETSRLGKPYPSPHDTKA